MVPPLFTSTDTLESTESGSECNVTVRKEDTVVTKDISIKKEKEEGTIVTKETAIGEEEGGTKESRESGSDSECIVIVKQEEDTVVTKDTENLVCGGEFREKSMGSSASREGQVECDPGPKLTVTSKASHNTTCDICGKTFSSKFVKKRHIKEVHESVRKKLAKASHNTCDICDKTFSSKFTKKRHVKEVHESVRTECSKSTAVQCKKCGGNFSRLNIYRQHLHQVHNIETTRVQCEFASEKEFMAWKDGLELEVGVNYTCHAGNKKSANSTKTIYYCRRSGVKKASQSTHKRAEKSQGTSKMGHYCTSSIEVVKQNGRIQVTYYVEHHDHDVDFQSLVHMTLPTSVKHKIAGMILRGVSHEHILEQVRKSAGDTRAALLDSQTIRNIVAQFGLKQKQKLHPDDSTSVDLNATDYREEDDHSWMDDSFMDEDFQPENYGEQLMNHINSQLLPLCNEISDQEVFKAADDYIGKAVAILSAAKNLASSDSSSSSSMFSVDLATKKEPANKPCAKQQKLYLTKRKRADTGQGLTKPSKKMRQKTGERKSYLSQMPVPMNSPPGDSQD